MQPAIRRIAIVSDPSWFITLTVASSEQKTLHCTMCEPHRLRHVNNFCSTVSPALFFPVCTATRALELPSSTFLKLSCDGSCPVARHALRSHLGRFPIFQEHLATRELFLAAVPMYAMLCDIFIIVAPPPIDDDGEAGISTHFRGGSFVTHLGVFRWVHWASHG